MSNQNSPKPVDPNETPEQRQAREEAARKEAAQPKDPAHRSGGIPLKES